MPFIITFSFFCHSLLQQFINLSTFCLGEEEKKIKLSLSFTSEKRQYDRIDRINQLSCVDFFLSFANGFLFGLISHNWLYPFAIIFFFFHFIIQCVKLFDCESRHQTSKKPVLYISPTRDPINLFVVFSTTQNIYCLVVGVFFVCVCVQKSKKEKRIHTRTSESYIGIGYLANKSNKELELISLT